MEGRPSLARQRGVNFSLFHLINSSESSQEPLIGLRAQQQRSTEKTHSLCRFHSFSVFATPCRSHQFEFPVKVLKFKASAPCFGAGNEEAALSFASYLVIMLCFIRHGSHLEINIGSDIKRDIMDCNQFETYLVLDPVS